MGAATLVDNIDPTRLRELMVERDVDVAALAADAGVSAKGGAYTGLYPRG
jgi:hypothetical protein